MTHIEKVIKELKLKALEEGVVLCCEQSSIGTKHYVMWISKPWVAHNEIISEELVLNSNGQALVGGYEFLMSIKDIPEFQGLVIKKSSKRAEKLKQIAETGTMQDIYDAAPWGRILALDGRKTGAKAAAGAKKAVKGPEKEI